jgi:hypothetical protein
MSDYLHHYEVTPETIPDAFDAMYSNKRDCVMVEMDDDKFSILEVDKVSKKIKYLNPIYEKSKIEEIVSRFKNYCIE